MTFSNNIIFKNFSILTGCNLAIQLLSIFSSIRIARVLQPSGYGLYNLVIIQASIFSIIAVYGLRMVIIRSVARNKDDARKIFTISNHIRTITTIISIIIAIVYNLIQADQTLTPLFLLTLSILIIFQTFWDTIESISFGFERMEATGLINLLFTIIWVGVVYIIPIKYFTVNTLIYTFVINQVAKTIVYYWWLYFKILTKQEVPTRITLNDHKKLIMQSNFFFILAVFTGIQNQIPILFLQFNSTIDQIGIFNLGYRILAPLQMILNMLLTALFPMFSRLALENRELFAKRVKTILTFIVLVGIWGSVCFALFSKDVVMLLYGERYLTSANVILIQCWYTVLFAIFCTIGTVLSSYDKQKQLSLLSFFYAIIAAPIFYFGTKYGAVGLAWAFVLSAYINMTYHWVIFKNLLRKEISIKYSFMIFSSMGLLLLFTSSYSINWSLNIRLILAFSFSAGLVLYLYSYGYSKIKLN